MWQLYDDLINPIPDNIYPSRIYQNGHCTIVEIDGKVGATVTNSQYNYKPLVKGYKEVNRGFSLAPMSEYKKLSFKELASLIKSWNFKEASIGAAAINAYYNRIDSIDTLIAENKCKICTNSDPFDELLEIGRDKVIVTIGHFGTKKPCFNSAKEVRIIEKATKKGDYPDSANEYMIKDADIVIVTGFTLINKTLPRILEVSKGKQIFFIGPSCPMSKVMFKYGITEIASSIFESFDNVKERAKSRTHKILVKIGKQVRIQSC